MKGAIPLARSVVTSTRIPHLEYHILCNRARSRARNQDSQSQARPPRPSPRPHRHQVQHGLTRSIATDASFNSWSSQELETTTNELQEVAGQTTDRHAWLTKPHNAHVDFMASQIVQQMSTRPETQLNSKRSDGDIDVAELLQESHPDRVMAWLIRHPSGHTFTAVADDDDFDRAFTALDPNVLVEPFKLLQRRQGRIPFAHSDLAFSTSVVKQLTKFTSDIERVMLRRLEHGRPLTLDICRHALQCAASAGDSRMADHLWYKLIPRYELQPDIHCCNAFISAHVWNLGHSHVAARSFRNTSRNTLLRSRSWRTKPLRGYRVAADRHASEPGWTLKSQVLAAFQDVTNWGLKTTEETFTNMILGLARARDVSAVDSILKSVWNIDHSALTNFDEEELESPTYYPDDDPLRPTDKLLFAIVHAYAINNDVAKAWTLLDYTSRNYALEIPEYVWNEMFEWTYVLGLRRSRSSRNRGQAEGRISPGELHNLYDKFCDQPYNMKPNPAILNLLTKSYCKRRITDKALESARLVEKDLLLVLQRLKLMVDTIKAIVSDPRGIHQNGIISAKFLDFRRDFQLTFLTARYQYDFLNVQAKNILHETHWGGAGPEQIWQRRHLPNFIEHFEAFLPSLCTYQTNTGTVSIQVRDNDADKLASCPLLSILLEAKTVYKTVMSSDIFRVTDNLGNLPTILEETSDSRRISSSTNESAKGRIPVRKSSI